MASSLLTGVSGLRAHQQVLDVVGNNLANANTPGFKAQRVRFSDLLYQTLAQATSSLPGATVGGTNPIQSGFGVRVGAIDTSLQQGSLQATGNNLDLSIQGNGFFVLGNGRDERYTRSGTFAVDSQNFLIDPATGFRVQRFGTVGEATATTPAFQVPGDTSIRIPFGTGIPGQATQSIFLQGNLSANATGPLAQTLTTIAPFERSAAVGGGPADAATLLNDLASNTTPYGATDQIRLQGTAVDGSAVDVTITVGPAYTVGDLLNDINANFPGSTAALDADGNVILTADNTGPNNLNLRISDVTGNTGATQWSNHGLQVTTTGKDGDTVTSAIQVFDTQGTAHNLSLLFRKVDINTWDITGSLPPGDGRVVDGLIGRVTFNEDGSFQQVNGSGDGDPFMTFIFDPITAPQTIAFTFGDPNGFNGLTQFGGSSTAAAVSRRTASPPASWPACRSGVRG